MTEAIATPVEDVVVKGERPSEQTIYERMWKEFPQYRQVAPGEDMAQLFLDVAKPKKGTTVVDMGCGTGRGSFMLAFNGLNVTMVDFASNCLDEDIVPMLITQSHALRFVQADLTKELPVKCELGYCTDVLEHIPPGDVDKVLDNTLMAAQHVFYQISTVDDVCGALIGHPLHLSVHPYEWWLKKFEERQCKVHWSRDGANACCFYVSAWTTGADMVDIGILNTGEDVVRANVKHNITQGYAQAIPYGSNDLEVMIIGGGPSLDARQLAKIRSMREQGVKLVALNGAHDWCLDQGLTPSAHIMVDARPFNARFTRRPVVRTEENPIGCHYMFASQCDPSVFEGVPKEQILLWHTSADIIQDLLQEQYADDVWYGIPGGSTVLLRAIPLLRMLGYRKYHLFGCDSCLQPKWNLRKADGHLFVSDFTNQPVEFNSWDDAAEFAEMVNDPDHDEENGGIRSNVSTIGMVPIENWKKHEHHNYTQPENDSSVVVPVTAHERMFQCHPWMLAQAQEFMDLIRALGHEFELEVHGDGLLGYLLEAGSDLEATLPMIDETAKAIETAETVTATETV